MKTLMLYSSARETTISRLTTEKKLQEENLADERDGIRPSEVVERKLRGVMTSSYLPVSSIHLDRLIRKRF